MGGLRGQRIGSELGRVIGGLRLCVNQTGDIKRGLWSEGTGSPGHNVKGRNGLTNIPWPANATIDGTTAGGATNVVAWVNGTLLSSAITPYVYGSGAMTDVAPVF